MTRQDRTIVVMTAAWCCAIVGCVGVLVEIMPFVAHAWPGVDPLVAEAMIGDIAQCVSIFCIVPAVILWMHSRDHMDPPPPIARAMRDRNPPVR